MSLDRHVTRSKATLATGRTYIYSLFLSCFSSRVYYVSGNGSSSQGKMRVETSRGKAGENDMTFLFEGDGR